METIFEVGCGRISEKQKYNYSSAYMLVYVREGESNEIMKELTTHDIPL